MKITKTVIRWTDRDGRRHEVSFLPCDRQKAWELYAKLERSRTVVECEMEG